MTGKIKLLDAFIILIVVLLLIITTAGLLSFSNNTTYNIVNQYGDNIEIFGNGVYKHNSLFKAGIFIGSDFSILIFIVPTLIYSYILNKRQNNIKTSLFLTSVLGIVFYYAFSIVFGVTYNFLFLIYTLLFSLSFFALLLNIRSLCKTHFSENLFHSLLTNNLKVFLSLCALSLFIAWLPDIITSLTLGKSLETIEVYTTDITYALDMGIISPLFIYTIYLLNKKDSLGIILMSILLTISVSIGIMVPFQSIFQMNMGISLPIEALVTKVGIFIILSAFSLCFLKKLYKNLKYEQL